MAYKTFTGKPFLLPEISQAAKQYNEARSKIDVKFLGAFQYSGVVPMSATAKDIGVKYPKDGLTSKFTLWEVINKGDYVLRNRPGERIIPRVDATKALKSYVVVPTICTNQSANLPHPCLFDAKYSKEYATMTDPGAVALAVNGKGIVQDTADTLVNDTTKIAKDGLKVMAGAEETAGIYFIGFSCANHSANMANEVLKNNFPDEYVGAEGVVPSESYNPALNSIRKYLRKTASLSARL